MRNIFIFSWQRFPALFIFGALLSGGLLANRIFFSLVFAFTHMKRSFQIGYLALSLFTALLFISFETKEPPTGTIEITAYVKPTKLIERNKRLFLLSNIIYGKTSDGNEYKNIDALLPISKKNRPRFDSHFISSGKLKKSDRGYFFIPSSFDKVPRSFSLVEKRWQLHKKVRKTIVSNIKDPDVSSYFSALATGDVSDPFLKERFLSCGMLHCLAISGFHFSWIIFLLSVPLLLFLPRELALILLLGLASLYFLFIGATFSISRAYLAIVVYLASILFSKVSLPLNALGIAGMVSMIINPYSFLSLSFSLSFLATFAILTLFSCGKKLTSFFCPMRDKKTLLLMPILHKVCYFILRFYLLSISLSLCVHLLLIPLFIAYFPFISLWGFLYNTFFPLSMVPTLLLLLLAFPFPSLWKVNEAISSPFLFTILYGKGWNFLLVKLYPLNKHLLAALCCACVLYCLRRESLAFEEYLIYQDEMLLTES